MSPEKKKNRKPLLVVLGLMALIAVSMLGFTLSSYVKQLQLFGEGWVGPKYFAFDVDSSAGAQRLAPGETAAYEFSVRNHDGNGVAQVPLHVSIEINYPVQLANTGSIYAELIHDGSVIASGSGSGTLAATGETLPANSATTDTYTLALTWENADMVYLGDHKDTVFDQSSIDIRVSGYQ